MEEPTVGQELYIGQNVLHVDNIVEPLDNIIEPRVYYHWIKLNGKEVKHPKIAWCLKSHWSKFLELVDELSVDHP